jgi:hypothetical protein
MFEWKISKSCGLREERQVKNKVIILFHIKGTVHKHFIRADHRVNTAYYHDTLGRMHLDMAQ